MLTVTKKEGNEILNFLDHCTTNILGNNVSYCYSELTPQFQSMPTSRLRETEKKFLTHDSQQQKSNHSSVDDEGIPKGIAKFFDEYNHLLY